MGTGDVFEVPYRHYWESRHFSSLLPKRKNLRILGIGCGAGRWALTLAPHAELYTGIDVSAGQLDVARRAATAAGIPNIFFEQVSALEYRPQDGQMFDIISFEGILQYLDDDQCAAILIKAQAWLAEGGLVIDRSTIVRELERHEVANDNYFCVYRTAAELQAMFESARFTLQYQRRTYRYLRFASLWKRGAVRSVFAAGTRYAPWLTFRLMYALSLCVDLVRGEAGSEPDGHFYSHDFHVFLPTENVR